MKNIVSLKLLWIVSFFIVLFWSACNPKDYFTWGLEVFPAILGFIILMLTRKNFPLTSLAYWFVLVHCIVLMVGGHYTYAEVPLFDTIKEFFNHSRNNYDKVGHFFQGFVPALLAKEIFIRKEVITSSKWTNFLVVCFTLGFSAFYELLEWWVAIFSKESAEAFLGTQGYVWDTQADMFLALIGAFCYLLFFSKSHIRQIKKLDNI